MRWLIKEPTNFLKIWSFLAPNGLICYKKWVHRIPVSACSRQRRPMQLSHTLQFALVGFYRYVNVEWNQVKFKSVLTYIDAMFYVLITIFYFCTHVNSMCYQSEIHRAATVRDKYLENKIFSRSGNFADGQGNLERTLKVREKSGNLKINGYGRESSENLFILLNRGKDVHSHETV